MTTRVILAGIAVVAPAWGFAAEVSGQSSQVPQNATVVFVSSQRISRESADGRAGQLRVQALQSERAAGLREMQQAVEATRRQLAQAPPAERSSLQQQEQEQRSVFELATLRAQADVQSLQREITLEIQARVKAILDDLLKGTDVQVVLQSENAVVWSAPGLDLTAAVIERLNAGSSSNGPARSR